jgi:hypothetical protein
MAMRRATVGAGLGLVLVASVLAATPAAGASRQVALGVWMQGSTNVEVYDRFSSEVGRAPAVWGMIGNWGSERAGRFPDVGFLNHLRRKRTVPMITWDPWDPKQPTLITQKRILAGRFDDKVREYAEAAKAWGGTLILRFAHEMDGYWYPWGVKYKGNTIARFRAVWKRVWNIFKGPNGVGATRVKFLWSPTGSQCSSICPEWKSFYPGNQYVDYVGMTGLNWGYPSTPFERRARPQATWRSMVQVLEAGMRDLRRVAPTKPIIIAELASTTDTRRAPRGSTKAGWITTGYKEVFARRGWSRIKAIVYYNIDMRANDPPHENWSLDAPAGRPKAAYAALLRQSRFQGRIR